MESQFPYLLALAFVFLIFIVIPSIRRGSKEKTFLKNLKKGDNYNQKDKEEYLEWYSKNVIN